MSYIDTSIIVSALDPSDVNNKKAREKLDIDNKIVSELVLLELASVIARKGKIKVRADDKILIIASLLYILKRFRLRYVNVDAKIKIPALGEFYSPFGIGLISNTKLKTLDLLHISYAKIMRDKGIINSFITADKEFKKVKDMKIDII